MGINVKYIALNLIIFMLSIKIFSEEIVIDMLNGEDKTYGIQSRCSKDQCWRYIKWLPTSLVTMLIFSWPDGVGFLKNLILMGGCCEFDTQAFIYMYVLHIV